MASVFKPKGSAKYVIFYTDENGRRRKKVACADKSIARRIAGEIENHVALRKAGLATVSLSARIIDRLLRTGLARDAPREFATDPSEARPIPPDLARYEDQLVPLEVSDPCIYFLVRDDVVVYVGQSVNLHVRVNAHPRDKRFDRVLYLPTPLEDLDRVERGFILALQPEYNLQGKGA
jgi:hypothetical protein